MNVSQQKRENEEGWESEIDEQFGSSANAVISEAI